MSVLGPLFPMWSRSPEKAMMARGRVDGMLDGDSPGIPDQRLGAGGKLPRAYGLQVPYFPLACSRG